jgi:selenocysteine lyase/cysteine desulfurase
VGTVNDLGAIRQLAQGAGALLVVDAVHFVPHLPVDVRAIGCDFLLCSAYKFFGPHIGVLYGRRAAFERLRCHKVLPQDDAIPFRMETGTPNFEGIAGAAAALDFIGGLGGPSAIAAYEDQLAARLRAGLATVPGVQLWQAPAEAPKTPTVAFTMNTLDAPAIARRLGDEGIFAWDGDFYATTLVKRLGLAARGGLVRLGLAPYNTMDEIDRTIAAVVKIASEGAGAQ